MDKEYLLQQIDKREKDLVKMIVESHKMNDELSQLNTKIEIAVSDIRNYQKHLENAE